MRDGAPVYGWLTTNIMEFESMLFDVSKADGRLTVDELKRMNCVQFYTHKKLLTEYIRRRRKNGGGDNSSS